ncbi:hypothetical protein SPFM12_00059 [Salmonella phage SPFM12]|nr:hypothetical protein SPFM12_00059 [Salmonella phage SPFM12]
MLELYQRAFDKQTPEQDTLFHYFGASDPEVARDKLRTVFALELPEAIDRKGESSEPRWLEEFFISEYNRVSSSNIPNQRCSLRGQLELRIRDFDTLVERLVGLELITEPLEYNGKEYLPFRRSLEAEFHKNTHNTLHRVITPMLFKWLSTLLRRKAVEARHLKKNSDRYYLSETTSHNRISLSTSPSNAWYFTSSLMG